MAKFHYLYTEDSTVVKYMHERTFIRETVGPVG